MPVILSDRRHAQTSWHQSGGIPVSASWPEMMNEAPAGLGETAGSTQRLSSGTEWT